jgi:hypothetical protein
VIVVANRRHYAVTFVRGSDVALEGYAATFDRMVMGRALKSFDEVPLLWRPWRPNQEPAFAEVGRVKQRQVDGTSLWVAAQLSKSSRYFETLKQLIAAGKLVFSEPALVDQLTASKSASMIGLKARGIVLQPSQHTMAQRRYLELATRLRVLQSR